MLDSVLYAKNKYLAKGGSGEYKIQSSLILVWQNQMNLWISNKLCMTEKVPNRDERYFH